MTCPHTNYTGQKKRDNICIDCWKERAEKAEAAAAEMRELVSWMQEHTQCCYPTAQTNRIKHALSSSCGQDYLPPDKARVLVEALKSIAGLRQQ